MTWISIILGVITGLPQAIKAIKEAVALIKQLHPSAQPAQNAELKAVAVQSAKAGDVQGLLDHVEKLKALVGAPGSNPQ